MRPILALALGMFVIGLVLFIIGIVPMTHSCICHIEDAACIQFCEDRIWFGTELAKYGGIAAIIGLGLVFLIGDAGDPASTKEEC